MTDTTTFFNNCVSWSRRFQDDLENLKSISDMIGADSTLSTNTAAAAVKAGRTELTTADFDNLKVCIDLLFDMLNAMNGESVPVSVNTGGSVKLGFYRMV